MTLSNTQISSLRILFEKTLTDDDCFLVTEQIPAFVSHLTQLSVNASPSQKIKISVIISSVTAYESRINDMPVGLELEPWSREMTARLRKCLMDLPCLEFGENSIAMFSDIITFLRRPDGTSLN